MAAPSITTLRTHLRSVLRQEDDLLREYDNMHKQLHTIDRELVRQTNRHSHPSASWFKQMRDLRREASWQMAMKREKMRPLVEKRRELLAQIVAMETKAKKAGEEVKIIKKAGEGSKAKKTDEGPKAKGR